MRILRKTLIYTVVGLAIVLIAAIASVFLFKDRLVEQFIREANKSINTPVKIGSITVSAFTNFPNLSIVFNDVYVEDSHPGDYPLLTAKTISFELNPVELYQKMYIVRGLRMTEGDASLRVNKAGVNNYTIVKKGEGGGSVSFDLHDIGLTATKVSYIDYSSSLHHEFSSKSLKATLAAVNDQYQIAAQGDVVIGQIGIGKRIYVANKSTNITTNLVYDDLAKTVKVGQSELRIANTRFDISGINDFKNKNLIDLKLSAKDADIQTLITLLPEKAMNRLSQYESKGNVYFDLYLKGAIGHGLQPALIIHFGCKDATLIHPETLSKIDSTTLEGTLIMPSVGRTEDGTLTLKKVRATLNGRPFAGDFELKDFDDPSVQLKFSGDLEAADLLRFYPIPAVSEVSGRINGKVSLSGRLALLKNKNTAQQVHTEGTIHLDSLHFKLGKDNLNFNHLVGALQFNNNDLAMTNLGGHFENSDFLLNGSFKNIVTWLLFENQPIGIEADLTSRFLDVDQLFDIGFGGESQEPYRFSISPNLNLNFACRIDSLQFKRFKATQVHGDLLVKSQMAVSRQIRFHSMGGALSLGAIVDAKNPKAIDLISSVTLEGIHLDSLFYVFYNFKQDFLQDKHLKGLTDATINFEATLNEGLHMFSETLVADVSAMVKKGELNNFEPLRRLNKYLDDEGLNKLRFGDLKNDIHIEKRTVYIPQMEVRTNVTTLELSGTHTFDQLIDYRVVTPLRNKKKVDPDEAFGAIEQDMDGKLKLYLKIVGTTEKYDVTYDQARVRKKIWADIKQEVKELKDAFTLKGKKKKKELELKKDDYFDWEDH